MKGSVIALRWSPFQWESVKNAYTGSRIKIIIILNEANRREWRKSIPRNAREIEPFTPTFPHHKPEHKTEFSSRKHNKSTRQSSKINTQLTTMPWHSVTRPMHVIYFRHSSPVEKKKRKININSTFLFSYGTEWKWLASDTWSRLPLDCK